MRLDAFLSRGVEMRLFFITLVRIYQKTVGVFFLFHCRFYPSCSEYSLLAFKKYGSGKGAYLTLKRIFKCHPYHPGGIDFP